MEPEELSSDGARRAIKQPSFDPERPLSLKFMDDGGSSEGAVDEGGPRREFFTVALRELNGGNMFAGRPNEGKVHPPQPQRQDFLSSVIITAASAVRPSVCSPTIRNKL